jgi:hypothetical protein
MARIGPLVVGATCLALVVASCTRSTGTSPLSTVGSPCRTGAHEHCLDPADNATTLDVTRGDEIRVTLSSADLRWKRPQVGDPAILRQITASSIQGGGIVADYVALSDGTTQLRASATPICVAGRACPQFVEGWSVTVSVAQ